MKVYSDLTPSCGDSAVALGNFDGLHIGHQKVIFSAVEEKQRGLVPSVLTFARNPLADLGGRAGGELITPEQKIQLLDDFGVEKLYILEFLTVKDLTEREFMEQILMRVCKAKKVCCGFNFTFGRGGRGTGETLSALCAERGLSAAVSEAVVSGGEPVSSTRIRALVANGEVDEAAKLLGRPYGYESLVQHGRRLGHRLGAPTVNQHIPDDFVLPRFGVYVSKVFLEGREYCGVTNVGVKPTVGSPCALAETWMPDYHGGDFYGKPVRVDLIKFLRPEMKFDSLAALQEAIHRNGEQAREYLLKNGFLSE